MPRLLVDIEIDSSPLENNGARLYLKYDVFDSLFSPSSGLIEKSFVGWITRELLV